MIDNKKVSHCDVLINFLLSGSHPAVQRTGSEELEEEVKDETYFSRLIYPPPQPLS